MKHPGQPCKVCQADQTPLPKRRCQGFGTLEVVIIIAVLLAVALLFRAALIDYASNLIETVLGDQQVIEDLALH